jgi:hypothetical protein
MRRARAFTLLEMLVACAFVAVIGALTADMFGGSRHERIEAAVRLLESDLAFARARSLAQPANPSHLRARVDGQAGYMVVSANDPSTAVTGPNGPVAAVFGMGRGGAAAGVAMTIVGGTSVAFGPFGGVMDPVPTIRLSMPDGPEVAVIAFDPFGGDMTVTYQSP